MSMLPSPGSLPQTDAPTLGLGGLPAKTAADYPTKFENVAPGSTVLVGGPAVEVPFEAIVLDAMPEYGPTAVPALMVAAKGTNEQFLLTSSGLYTVTVLVDAKQIAATMPPPEHSIKVRTITRTADAIQFKGGIESASEIVRWAIGSTTFRYNSGTDEIADHLLQSGVGGVAVWAGDWVIKLDSGQFRVADDKTFASEFEAA